MPAPRRRSKDFTYRVRGLLPPEYIEYGWVSTRTKDGKPLLKPTTIFATFNDFTPHGCGGWLEKKRSDDGGILSGAWHRRWFVCKGTSLTKYESNVHGDGKVRLSFLRVHLFAAS